MSSSKSNKKWKDKVVKDFLKGSKLTEGSIFRFQDQITFAKNPNDVPLHRERIFEEKVYRISKIDKKDCKPPKPKKEVKPNIDISPDKRELVAEIDRKLKHLKDQKKFIEMAREPNKTWDEHFTANQSGKRNENNPRKCPTACDAHVCDVLQKFIVKNCVKVTDSYTQMEPPTQHRMSKRQDYFTPQCVNNKTKNVYDGHICNTENFTQNVNLSSDCSFVDIDWRTHKDPCTTRTVPVKMVDSGTQVRASKKCHNHQSVKKNVLGHCQPTSSDSNLSSPRFGMTACEALEFLTGTEPDCRSRPLNQREDYCSDDSHDRFETTYMSSYRPHNFVGKQTECRVETNRRKLPEFLLDEQNLKKDMKPKNKGFSPKPYSPRKTGKTSALSPRIDSIDKDLKSMRNKQVRLSKEIEEHVRRTCQKSPRSKVSNLQSPVRKVRPNSQVSVPSPRKVEKSRQVKQTSLDSARSSRQKSKSPEFKNCPSQGSLYLKTVKSRQIIKQSPTRTFTISEKRTKIEESRQKSQSVHKESSHKSSNARNWQSGSQLNRSSTKKAIQTYKPSSPEIYKTSEYYDEMQSQQMCSKSPTNNLSAASSSARSCNIIKPNVIDDNTYTCPNNDENVGYSILPYRQKKLSQDIIEKSKVILEDASSREFQRCTAITNLEDMPFQLESNQKDSSIHQFELKEPLESQMNQCELKDISCKTDSSYNDQICTSTSPQYKTNEVSYKSESDHKPQMNDSISPRIYPYEIKDRYFTSESSTYPQIRAPPPSLAEMKDMSYRSEASRELQTNASISPHSYQYEVKMSSKSNSSGEAKMKKGNLSYKSELSRDHQTNASISPKVRSIEIKDNMYFKSELSRDFPTKASMSPLSNSFEPKEVSNESGSRHKPQMNASISPQYTVKDISYKSDSTFHRQMNTLTSSQYKTKEDSYESETYRQHQMNDSISPYWTNMNFRSESSHDPRMKCSISPQPRLCEVKNSPSKSEPNLKPQTNASISPRSHEFETFKPNAFSSENNNSTSYFKEDRLSKSDHELKSYTKLSKEMSNHLQSFNNSLNEGCGCSGIPLKTEEQSSIRSKIDEHMTDESQEDVFLSETQNEKLHIEGIDSDLLSFIQYLQNRIKECDEVVRKQVAKNNQDHRNSPRNIEVYRLEHQSTYEGDKAQQENISPLASVKTETKIESLNLGQEEIDELVPDEISENEVEFQSACRFFWEENLTPVHSEIPPFAGCDCMKEDYYKIMRIVYNK